MFLKKFYFFKKNRRHVFISVCVFAILSLIFIKKNANNEIYAVDPLVVSYNGQSPPSPIFEISNFLPGDEIEKNFEIKNLSPQTQSVFLKAVKIEESQNFSNILEVVVGLKNGAYIFGGSLGVKTLNNLFSSEKIDLGQLSPNEQKTFRIKVSFPAHAGNEYQNAKVIFDLIFANEIFEIKLPPECEELQGLVTKVVEGTLGNDIIHASSANELILAFEGNDKIYGNSGHDCIVAHDGNDHVFGGSGNDIVIAGNGNDKIEADSGDDKILAGDGNDDILGGSGNDKIYLGFGNDVLRGESGNDFLYGQARNDSLFGESGNDFLNGGEDIDNLHGGSGIDTCQEGETNHSCEI